MQQPMMLPGSEEEVTKNTVLYTERKKQRTMLGRGAAKRERRLMESGKVGIGLGRSSISYSDKRME